MRSRNQRSWLMTTAQPAKLSSASSSARSVSTSRSLVGSSSSSRLLPLLQQLGEVDAIALAARQRADLPLLAAALEVEPRHVGARRDLPLAELDLVVAAGDLLEHGLVRVERVAALIDVADLHRLADPQRAGVRLLLPGDHPEQRRLAGAVRTDHADDAAARQGEVEVVDQQVVAVALAQTPRASTTTSPSRGPGRDVDLGGLDLLRRSLRAAALRRRSGAPCPWPGARAATCGSIRARARASAACASPPSLPAAGGSASARATTSSCPPTGCRARDRARESSRRRCRGNSDRG